MNHYAVITVDERYVNVFARDHEVSNGDLILYYTQQGMYTDTFPDGYWTRFAVNGVEVQLDKSEEVS